MSAIGRKWVGSLALVGAAGLAIWAARPRPQSFDVDAFVRALDGKLREVRAGLHTRVSTLAELPRLAVAVATDAPTLRDLTQDELAFRPHPGETIAIGQLPRRPGMAPLLLLVAPETGYAPPFDIGDSSFQVRGSTLLATEAVSVAPRERAQELEGVVAVTWSVDLSAFEKTLVAAGVQAQVNAAVGSLTLGMATPPPGAKRYEAKLLDDNPLKTREGPRVSVLATPPPPIYLAWGAAAVLAMLGAFALRRRPRTDDDDAEDLSARISTRISARISARISTGTSWRTSEQIVPRAGWTPGSGPTASGPTALRSVDSGPTTGPTPGWRNLSPHPIGVPILPIGRVGRYDPIRKIGSGAMADVYLARATGEAGFAKLVALKVLLPEFASIPQVVEYFLDEARLAAQLDHPNVVLTVDLGHTGDHYFIAMEHIDGADLLHLIGMSNWQKQPVPLGVALAILRGICNGLQSAHDAREADGSPMGLVHRDVKSANVFISRSGAVKVGDFGIAKAHHAGWVRRTENGLVRGTPGYMAPEQRLGLPIDARADLYSVGAIAYEMLTGQPINLDLLVLAAKGRDGWPHLPPISSLRADVPPELEAIVGRALSYEREARYPDCATMEVALERVAVARPPVAADKAVARWIEGLLTSEPGFATAATPQPHVSSP